MCHYCHNPGYIRRNCRKLQNKNQRFQSVHYQKSLKSASTSTTTLAKSGKTNTCFLSSSSIWVIDSRATDHMACNSSLFTTFQSHPSLSLLKKLYPQFSSLSSLNCESCQYAKLHLVHLSPRVNKRASAPFELVHLDV